MKQFRDFFIDSHGFWPVSHYEEPVCTALSRMAETMADYVDLAVREALFGTAAAPISGPTFMDLASAVAVAMRAKATVRKTAYFCESHGIGESIVEFRAWLNEQIEAIPEQFRAAAKIEMRPTTVWDTPRLEVEISYGRPETDNEVAAREMQATQIAADVDAHERAEFERLKLKFGGA